MRLQHTELISGNETEEAPAEEVKKPVDTKKKKFALVAVCFGDGIKETFQELGVDYIIAGGHTLNPSTEDFV